MTGYEQKKENYDEIPVVSRRSQQENHLLEYLRLREEIETRFKEIREKKKRIADLLEKDESLKDIDARLRKIPRDAEEKRKKRKIAITSDSEKEDKEEKERKKKIKNAIKNKKQQAKSYIRQGYTMTEKEIRKEGGEIEQQFVFFKELGDGQSSTHVMKGMHGLKLSSLMGEENQMQE